MARKKVWKARAKALKRANRALRKAMAAAKPAAAVSPLAPAAFPDLPAVAGVGLATADAGPRYPGRDDLLLVRLAPGTTLAGVFTRSATRAAPVDDATEKLSGKTDSGAGAAILVNAGNANAFTGAAGPQAVTTLSRAAAEAGGVPQGRVLTASTGVIGEVMDPAPLAAALPDLAARCGQASWQDAARAIMTTDTFAKGAGRAVEIDGQTVTIAGIAKGSGMIAPDMATMLGFVFTDARIAPATLRKLLTRATARSFNCITVDGDTSTNDTVLLAATGQTGAGIDDLRGRPARAFAEALEAVMGDLARQIVKDGEGASKFLTVRVTGADSEADARRVAAAIANSPLVKTAIAGEDPNWGRIVMAVGKSGARADRDRLTIRFGEMPVAREGAVASDYAEKAGAAYMKRPEIEIGVDLGFGDAAAEIWTCDLTARYVEINADYRS